jgi:hypothetical protein
VRIRAKLYKLHKVDTDFSEEQKWSGQGQEHNEADVGIISSLAKQDLQQQSFQGSSPE